MKTANKRSGAATAKSRKLAPVSKAVAAVDPSALLADLRTLIQSARQRIATVAYSTQTLLCWQLGQRLLNENLQGGRAAYGKRILVTVSRELTAEYGRGFSYAEVARMSGDLHWAYLPFPFAEEVGQFRARASMFRHHSSSRGNGISR